MAARYKQHEFSVIVAGLKAMGKGHSFECARYLFLPSLSYAMDENEQFIHRVWRLNSPKDVHIFPFIMQNTIDELMLAGFNDKMDSAQLGLDGRLIEQQVQEIDSAELLAKAVRNFNPHAPTIDESDIVREWEDGLRDRLSAAESSYRAHHAARAAHLLPVAEVPNDFALALAAYRKLHRTNRKAA